MIYYRKPIHTLEAFAHIPSCEGSCKTADEASRTCLSLPMHAYLQESELDKISGLV